jgi:chaperone required for assembly of F1-ATPase
MSDPQTEKPRRFYREVTVEPFNGEFAVLLDGRLAKTPGGKALAAPTEALGRLLADEWDAQAERIDIFAMPAVRLAFTAIDRTGQVRDGVAEEVARYAGSDLLCYLAEDPVELAEREAKAWGPWLAWAERDLGLTLTPSFGIAPARQAPEALDRARAVAAEADDFGLSGLHFAAGLYGSAVLAFAVQRGALDAAEAFDLSRLDEAFQEERWGVDSEAAARVAALRTEAEMIGRWFEALRG